MAETSRDHDDNGTTTTTATAAAERTAPPVVDRLPQWKVLLHDDDQNEMWYVVDTIVMLTPLNRHAATLRMLEAHQARLSMLMTTHREHAELLQEQFGSKGLTVTIEAGS